MYFWITLSFNEVFEILTEKHYKLEICDTWFTAIKSNNI